MEDLCVRPSQAAYQQTMHYLGGGTGGAAAGPGGQQQQQGWLQVGVGGGQWGRGRGVRHSSSAACMQAQTTGRKLHAFFVPACLVCLAHHDPPPSTHPNQQSMSPPSAA